MWKVHVTSTSSSGSEIFIGIEEQNRRPYHPLRYALQPERTEETGSELVFGSSGFGRTEAMSLSTKELELELSVGVSIFSKKKCSRLCLFKIKVLFLFNETNTKV